MEETIKELESLQLEFIEKLNEIDADNLTLISKESIKYKGMTLYESDYTDIIKIKIRIDKRKSKDILLISYTDSPTPTSKELILPDGDYGHIRIKSNPKKLIELHSNLKNKIADNKRKNIINNIKSLLKFI